MLADYELRRVTSESDWTAYHRIRRTVLFEGRGRFDYNEDGPDERVPTNHSLVLLYMDLYFGTVRLDFVEPDLGIIRLFAIDRPFQRIGHGTNFLALLADYAAARGVAVFEANAAPEAVGFWQRKGFDVIDGARAFPLLRRDVAGPILVKRP